MNKEITLCRICGVEMKRENYSELMLNLKMGLINLCPKHFKYEKVR